MQWIQPRIRETSGFYVSLRVEYCDINVNVTSENYFQFNIQRSGYANFRRINFTTWEYTESVLSVKNIYYIYNIEAFNEEETTKPSVAAIVIQDLGMYVC